MKAQPRHIQIVGSNLNSKFKKPTYVGMNILQYIKIIYIDKSNLFLSILMYQCHGAKHLLKILIFGILSDDGLYDRNI
jgi:hypothetical protein